MLLSVKKINLNFVSFSLKQAQIFANGARKSSCLKYIFLPHWLVLSKILIFFFSKQDLIY